MFTCNEVFTILLMGLLCGLWVANTAIRPIIIILGIVYVIALALR